MKCQEIVGSQLWAENVPAGMAFKRTEDYHNNGDSRLSNNTIFVGLATTMEMDDELKRGADKYRDFVLAMDQYGTVHRVPKKEPVMPTVAQFVTLPLKGH